MKGGEGGMVCTVRQKEGGAKAAEAGRENRILSGVGRGERPGEFLPHFSE
jgi:hypothetical protein